MFCKVARETTDVSACPDGLALFCQCLSGFAPAVNFASVVSVAHHSTVTGDGPGRLWCLPVKGEGTGGSGRVGSSWWWPKRGSSGGSGTGAGEPEAWGRRKGPSCNQAYVPRDRT